jgi:hypothetical protein
VSGSQVSVFKPHLQLTLLLIATILYGLAGTSGIYLESLPAILVGRAFLGLAVADDRVWIDESPNHLPKRLA